MGIFTVIIFASVLLICHGQRITTSIPVETTPTTPDLNQECQNQLKTNSSTRGEMTNDGCTLECTNTGDEDIQSPIPVTVINGLGQSRTQTTIPRGQKASLPANDGKDCGNEGETCQNGECEGDGDSDDFDDLFPDDLFKK